MARKRCPVVFDDPKLPNLIGTRCLLQRTPHEGMRHFAEVNGALIHWWTEEEKAEFRYRRKR